MKEEISGICSDTRVTASGLFTPNLSNSSQNILSYFLLTYSTNDLSLPSPSTNEEGGGGEVEKGGEEEEEEEEEGGEVEKGAEEEEEEEGGEVEKGAEEEEEEKWRRRLVRSS